MDIRTYANAQGGFPRVAEQLGFNAEFLRQVAKGRRRVSPQNAIRIEMATHGLVTRAELRPDIFGPIDANPDRGGGVAEPPSTGDPPEGAAPLTGFNRLMGEG